jgi:endonuclease/exonuclease/phosphatase family metal-dependent hydrolase
LNFSTIAQADQTVIDEEIISIAISGPADSANDLSNPGPPAGSIPASFLTFNICGSSRSEYCQGDPVDELVKYIEKNKPTAFALQEVCGSQANKISKKLRELGLDYVQRYRNLSRSIGPVRFAFLCDKPSMGEGIALFHAGTTLGEVQEGEFKVLAGGRFNRRPRGYVCVKVVQPEFWACTTHIEVIRGRAQRAQIKQLAGIAEQLNTPDSNGRRTPVIVGGDFNVTPMPRFGLRYKHLAQVVLPYSSLNPMLDSDRYDHGTGQLLEFDIPSDRYVRKIKATHGDEKLDYIFHSEDVFVDSSEVFPAVDADYEHDYPDWPDWSSDHRILFNKLHLF